MKTLRFLLCLSIVSVAELFPVVDAVPGSSSFPGSVAVPGSSSFPGSVAVPGSSSFPGSAPVSVLGTASVLGLVLGPTPAWAHVFYVSITRVKWNVEEARLDVTVRIFTDDLEEAIVAEGGPRLRLWTDQARADRDRHVADYLLSRLAFRVNGQERVPAYSGMEDALDATACLVQITNVDRVESIEVENRILIDMFDTQANVMRFEVGGEKKYVNLSKGTVKGVVRFGS